MPEGEPEQTTDGDGEKPAKKRGTHAHSAARALPTTASLSESLAKFFIKQGRYERARNYIGLKLEISKKVLTLQTNCASCKN